MTTTQHTNVTRTGDIAPGTHTGHCTGEVTRQPGSGLRCACGAYSRTITRYTATFGPSYARHEMILDCASIADARHDLALLFDTPISDFVNLVITS